MSWVTFQPTCFLTSVTHHFAPDPLCRCWSLASRAEQSVGSPRLQWRWSPRLLVAAHLTSLTRAALLWASRRHPAASTAGEKEREVQELPTEERKVTFICLY